jgi:hypothetical protein
MVPPAGRPVMPARVRTGTAARGGQGADESFGHAGRNGGAQRMGRVSTGWPGANRKQSAPARLVDALAACPKPSTTLSTTPQLAGAAGWARPGWPTGGQSVGGCCASTKHGGGRPSGSEVRRRAVCRHNANCRGCRRVSQASPGWQQLPGFCTPDPDAHLRGVCTGGFRAPSAPMDNDTSGPVLVLLWPSEHDVTHCGKGAASIYGGAMRASVLTTWERVPCNRTAAPHQAPGAHLVAAWHDAGAARRVEGHAGRVRREGCVGAASAGGQGRLRASGQKEGSPGRDAVVQASVRAKVRAGKQRGPASPRPPPLPLPDESRVTAACGSLGALGGCRPNSGPHHDGDISARGLAPLGGRAHIHRQAALPGAVSGAEGVHLWQGVAGWSDERAIGRRGTHGAWRLGMAPRGAGTLAGRCDQGLAVRTGQHAAAHPDHAAAPAHAEGCR